MTGGITFPFVGNGVFCALEYIVININYNERKRGEVYETKKKSCHFIGGDACVTNDAAASGKSGRGVRHF